MTETPYVELFLNQGADFYTTVTLADDDTNEAISLDGCVIKSSLKKSILSQNTYANLVCNITDSTNGVFTIEMTASNTSNLRAGSYIFDIKITDSNNFTTRLAEGIMLVQPSVTS